MDDSLLKNRRRVNRIDNKLAKLLVKRYNAVQLIGGLKRGEDRDIVDRDREDKVLERVLSFAEKEGQKKYIRSIYGVIFRESSNVQRMEV